MPKKHGIAIIHQELMLSENLSIAENIFLGKELGSPVNLNYHKMVEESKKVSSNARF